VLYTSLTEECQYEVFVTRFEMSQK